MKNTRSMAPKDIERSAIAKLLGAVALALIPFLSVWYIVHTVCQHLVALPPIR